METISHQIIYTAVRSGLHSTLDLVIMGKVSRYSFNYLKKNIIFFSFPLTSIVSYKVFFQFISMTGDSELWTTEFSEYILHPQLSCKWLALVGIERTVFKMKSVHFLKDGIGRKRALFHLPRKSHSQHYCKYRDNQRKM